MKENKHTGAVPSLLKEDSFEVEQISRGFTLVPCWVVREDGQRVRGCKWAKIAPRVGEI